MKHHALFVIFEKAINVLNCRLLQIIGDALRVKMTYLLALLYVMFLKFLSLSHAVSWVRCGTPDLRLPPYFYKPSI